MHHQAEGQWLDDRRDNLRQSSRMHQVVLEHAEAGLILCTIEDVSRGGLRVRLHTSLPCGAEVLVHPPEGTSLKPEPARIVRQQLIDCGAEEIFECGIHFTDEAAQARHTWFLTLRKAA